MLCISRAVCLGAALLIGAFMSASWAAEGDAPKPLKSNGDFESDANGDQWPDDWAKVEHGSWQTEGDNHFLRLENAQPDEMVMLYQEIAVPEGVEAIELRWKQRTTGLKVGANAWFDARILLEFFDANREKVSPSPAAPATRKDTDGWQEKSVSFLVPTGAKTLKFMPCLFRVAAGKFDLDDVSLAPTDPAPLRAAQEAAAKAKQEKQETQAKARRAKAAALLAERGSLLTNGDFEADKKNAGWPDDWGRLKTGGGWELEDGNRFLRITATEPDQMTMLYRTADIPEGVQALELTWKQRVSGLKTGSSPWFDARILLELHGVDGKKIGPAPSAAYTQKNTDGWTTKSTRFLVPPDALTVVLMPCLFKVRAGTFDLDEIVLKPTDPQPLIAAAEKRAAEAKARYVPPEEPNRAKWPPMVKVVGNRLQDPSGKEVWLQGVNAGGLETLPQEVQPIKSVVVAIDEWKANCVRVPIKDDFWYGKSPYQQDQGAGYRKTIDQIITLAANRGAYVVIDLHRFRAPKAEHAAFWKDFAAQYKDHPAVLFDLFNEPHGISWEVWKNGGFVATNEGTDESAFLTEAEKKANQGFQSIGMQALVNAVRETGAKNVVIAGGLFWCNDLSGIVKGYALDDPNGNGVMYSWHTYNWHKDWDGKVLETAKLHPIFLGEVGADAKKMNFIPAEAQEDPYTWVPDMLGYVQKHRLNWTGWCLHPSASPVMISDWLYTPTPFWGQMAKDALSGKQFEMQRTR
ncbi:MAG TPA: glycoside hydrolase family 5 protein [Pirellulales bacterium]